MTAAHAPFTMKICCHLTISLAIVLLCSCSADDDRLPVFPVQGKVLYQDQPADGALVIFNPTDVKGEATIVPSGTVQADGSFQLTSYETADGAPAGAYRVTIRWPEPPKSPLDKPDMGDDRLRNRFTDPERSLWRVTVVEGENQLEPFRVD